MKNSIFVAVVVVEWWFLRESGRGDDGQEVASLDVISLGGFCKRYLKTTPTCEAFGDVFDHLSANFGMDFGLGGREVRLRQLIAGTWHRGTLRRFGFQRRSRLF